MKQILCLLAIIVFLHIGSQAWSQDVGSQECGMAQQAVQDVVASGGPYKNHGQWVKTAVQAANLDLYDGTITGECHGCIVNQFARKIPIPEQEPCGPIVLTCFDNSGCSSEKYCKKAVGDCEGQGTCEEKPLVSVLISDPVCGCDGTTYENTCAAAEVGISVNYGGECGVECAHDLCVMGDPLDPACAICVATVCNYDPRCCSGVWDDLCVGEAIGMCRLRCPEQTCAGAGFCGAEVPGGCCCDAKFCVAGDICADAESRRGIVYD